MFITGSNKNFIEAKKLKDKKYRRLTGNYLIEGEKLIRDALRLGAITERVFVCADLAERYADLTERIDNVYEMDERFISDLSETVTPQGIVAVCSRKNAEIKPPEGRAVILENIQDPANVGAILRTAMGLGYNDVYLCNSADAYSMKCLRGGMTAQFVLNLYECGLDEALKANSDNLLICADMDGTNIRAVEGVPRKHTVVLGNEGNGVSERVKLACERVVAIPMENGLESFNVAVSAGIMMYALSGNIR